MSSVARGDELSEAESAASEGVDEVRGSDASEEAPFSSVAHGLVCRLCGTVLCVQDGDGPRDSPRTVDDALEPNDAEPGEPPPAASLPAPPPAPREPKPKITVRGAPCTPPRPHQKRERHL